VILKGVDPPLPHEVLDSTDPAIEAILQARKLATTYDVDERPRARDVANFLVEAASQLSQYGDIKFLDAGGRRYTPRRSRPRR
jgi:hypothetical protein